MTTTEHQLYFRTEWVSYYRSHPLAEAITAMQGFNYRGDLPNAQQLAAIQVVFERATGFIG